MKCTYMLFCINNYKVYVAAIKETSQDLASAQ